MESLYTYVSPPSSCGYLPSEQWSLEYTYFLDLEPEDYMRLMEQGWRRFGHMVFRPRCRSCSACRSLRVPAESFLPNRSQRRAWDANANDVRLRIGPPICNVEKLKLYDRYHAFQSDAKHWPSHPPKDVASYRESFVNNPFLTEEWCYYLDDKLVGVGYVDRLPSGLSAIYFFYDPDRRDRSLGTFNVLSVLADAKRNRIPHVYLGYFVPDCPSLAYKAKFRPNELLLPDSTWHANEESGNLGES